MDAPQKFKLIRANPTHSRQYEVYLKYLTKHPPRNGDLLLHELYWDAMTAELNSIAEGPIKSSTEWHVTLRNWRNTVRQRERIFKIRSTTETGGPPPKPLTYIEQQALSLWGRRHSIDGAAPASVRRAEPGRINEADKAPHSEPEPNAGQLAIFLLHLTEHEDLRTPDGDPRIVNALWKSLTLQLNAYIGGAIKTPRKWHKTLRSWQNNVRNKWRLIQEGNIKLSLTELEERLVMLDSLPDDVQVAIAVNRLSDRIGDMVEQVVKRNEILVAMAQSQQDVLDCLRQSLTEEGNEMETGDDTVDEEAKVNECKFRLRRQNKVLRDTSNPFSMPEQEFRKMFRLSRAVAEDLAKEILAKNPALALIQSNAIPFHLKLLSALNFFANGNFQKPTGDSRVYAQSQAAISRGLHLVLAELIKLSGKYIKFPATPTEIATNKAAFLQTFGMHDIVCAIDGAHISIVQPPTLENGHLFYNKFRYTSLNVLGACNARGEFIYADANYPGSVRDSHVYEMTALRTHLPDTDAYMLGDADYPSNHYCLLTPVANAETDTKEASYNQAHQYAHSIVTDSFALLKRRFRCLTRQRTLHYRPKVAAQITYACMVLHNICVSRNIEEVPAGDGEDEAVTEDEVFNDDDGDVGGPLGDEENVVDLNSVRNSYIELHF